MHFIFITAQVAELNLFASVWMLILQTILLILKIMILELQKLYAYFTLIPLNSVPRFWIEIAYILKLNIFSHN